MTFGDLITDALLEIGVARAGDVPAPEVFAFALDKLNRLLDNWNAERAAVYSDRFQTFVITPSLAPHTIGVAANTPTWVVTGNRPEEIVDANLILTDVTPNVKSRIRIRDAAWWAALSVPAMTSTLPTDLYYEPDWPNGSCYLWPVPTTAYSVELQLRVVLGQVALVDTVSLPPGYQDAITLTLAEACAPGMGQVISPDTKDAARGARARIFDANGMPGHLSTRDSGMGGRRSRSRTTFNYRSRSF